MKNKKRLIPIVIVALVLFLLICTAIKGWGISKGRYLYGNEATMIVLDNSLIQMFNRTNKDLFDGLHIGDEILVIHDGIAETYPGKTGVYAVFKLSEGRAGNIPKTVKKQMVDLGLWETGTSE